MTTPMVSQRPVLLVDDEPALLRSASLLLRAAGIEPIHTLDDSRQVLSRVADDTHGVVVLDLTIPHRRSWSRSPPTPRTCLPSS